MRLPEWIFSIYCLSMHCKRVRVNGIFLGLQQKSQAFFPEQIISILLQSCLFFASLCKINNGNTLAKKKICARFVKPTTSERIRIHIMKYFVKPIRWKQIANICFFQTIQFCCGPVWKVNLRNLRLLYISLKLTVLPIWSFST